MSALITFLNERPALKKTYVNFGTDLVNFIVQPLSLFMRHLVVVQGLDPDVDPGAREQQAFCDALNKSLNTIEDKEYDKDFNVDSFLRKKWKETNKLLNSDLS